MRTLVQAILICFFAPAIVLWAQEQTSAAAVALQVNPLIEDNEQLYDGVKKILRRTAEVMPEEDYGFKPTETVRSFGQIVGHVADAQYIFCSKVLGEQNPAPGVEKQVTSKAGLITALDAAFAYCDRAYEVLTDASAVEKVNLMGTEKPKLGVLSVNQVHTIEHYGNLVTYLRMNDIVPPTSDRDFMQQLQKR
ncbi:MAG TPA: DinB family protein [Thermoanaerobaculia bacterium]|nr:DinB family protein [Thermoanaerobaculia bacterium]